jgi:hypothetical protein
LLQRVAAAGAEAVAVLQRSKIKASTSLLYRRPFALIWVYWRLDCYTGLISCAIFFSF